VVIVLGAVWSRFTPAAAFYTLVLGFIINVTSMFFPAMVTPFAHGEDPSDGHSYMRAFFGVLISVALGVIITFFTQPRKREEIPGLVAATVREGMRISKGSEPDEENAGRKICGLQLEVVQERGVQLSQLDMEKLHAKPGDLLYLSDNRSRLGGLRSLHIKIGAPHDKSGVVRISQDMLEEGNLLSDRPVMVEKIL